MCGVLAIVLGAGFTFRFKGSSDPFERFAGSRQISWLRLGASMAAASTSADTPLLIASAVYLDGLSGNWFWWVSAPGILATLFFFAPLWRRSGALTEIEIVKLRYGDSGAARMFRILRAFVDGLIINSLVLATNTFAFSLLLRAWLPHMGMPSSASLAEDVTALLLIAAGAYAILVGFRGVVRADSVEFLTVLLTSGLLAWFAVSGLPHGFDSLREMTAQRGATPVFNVWPAGDSGLLLLLLALGWWHTAPGNGMLIQRMNASRDEREARFTVLTFATLHYVLRPWAWYLIGAAALYFVPDLRRTDEALPAVAAIVLPNGFFGLLVITIALAFLGSSNSRFNYCASYLVNDVAHVLRPGLGSRSLRWVEIAGVLLLAITVLALVRSGAMPAIRTMYQFLIMLMAGSGFVAIARWYWWRTSLASEITSLASSIGVASVSLFVVDMARPRDFALMVGINFCVGALVAISAAYIWPARNAAVAEDFYERVRPSGPGWLKYGRTGEFVGPALAWVGANGTLFSMTYAIASLFAGDIWRSAACAICAIGCACCGLPATRRLLKRVFPILMPGKEARGR
jgi:Na+/proline symporter